METSDIADNDVWKKHESGARNPPQESGGEPLPGSVDIPRHDADGCEGLPDTALQACNLRLSTRRQIWPQATNLRGVRNMLHLLTLRISSLKGRSLHRKKGEMFDSVKEVFVQSLPSSVFDTNEKPSLKSVRDRFARLEEKRRDFAKRHALQSGNMESVTETDQLLDDLILEKDE